MTPHFQRCCENWAWRGHSHLCVTSNKLAVARVVSHRRCQEELPNLAKCGSVPKLNFFIWHHLGPMRPRSRGSCGPCYRGAHFLFVVDLELLIQVCAVMSRILCWGGSDPELRACSARTLPTGLHPQPTASSLMVTQQVLSLALYMVLAGAKAVLEPWHPYT